MNLSHMQCGLDTVLYSGSTMSSEDFCVLENSLYVLQTENHFREIYFWGRIYGLEDDYFIAFGYDKDCIRGRTYYYSTNCLDWGLLPHPTYEAKALTPLATCRFHGDPPVQYDILKGNPMESPELPRTDPTLPDNLKEEDRLAATVFMIDDEAAIVPRGALYKRPDDVVVKNKAFKGLTMEESKNFYSYQHYRPPQHRWNTNLLEHQEFNMYLDFLDTIDLDIPYCQTWSIQHVRGGEFVILNSLYWPGMTFYHKLGTQEHGFYYCGIGKKNMDILFMFDHLNQLPE